VKKKILVTEFWGLGDLAIGSTFLKSASAEFDLLLVAKPYAVELGKELWPSVKVLPFVAPWTQFRGKYHLHRWPWKEMRNLLKRVRAFSPDIALSARWDPRDHFVLSLSGAPRRIGFPRTGSQILLTDALPAVGQDAPRTAQWDRLGEALRIDPRTSAGPTLSLSDGPKRAVFHTGAAQALRVWPIERYNLLASQLHEQGWEVEIVCDDSQVVQWKELGRAPHSPKNPTDLITILRSGQLFIGNDSGPGHLAAALGIPTFTVFGPQRPEWFLPNHPNAGWIEGKPCPHKPCFDYCRFPTPTCILDNSYEDVSSSVQDWISRLEQPR
jgi:ADP-heptose:LPS heptosyltransferase